MGKYFFYEEGHEGMKEDNFGQLAMLRTFITRLYDEICTKRL